MAERTRKAVTHLTPRPARRLKFRDSSWDTIKDLLSLEMDGYPYSMNFLGAKAVEDTGDLLVVEVETPRRVSIIARRHAQDIYAVLALVNRPKTRVRLRTNLADSHEAPDYYYRDLDKPAAPARQGRVIAESATRRRVKPAHSAT